MDLPNNPPQLRSISKNELDEMKSLANPPQHVKIILEAIMLLFGESKVMAKVCVTLSLRSHGTSNRFQTDLAPNDLDCSNVTHP